MKKNYLILLLTLTVWACSMKAEEYPYQDSTLSISERVDDLIGRMTVEEKFWQLFMIPGEVKGNEELLKNGIFGLQLQTKSLGKNASEQMMDYGVIRSTPYQAAKKANEIQKFFMEESRLKIPVIFFDEALHGLVRDGATAFPQSISLAASWNKEMMEKVCQVISTEVKSRGIRQALSPVVNIARDARWGRVEESYGEDPYLSSVMGGIFTRVFENNQVIVTPKHFAVNVGDGGRDSYPIHYNERLLREIYFPAYKECVDLGARSLMISYNSLDGTPCSANHWLLNDILKEEWGFKGFVISDAGAVGGAIALHRTAETWEESIRDGIVGGLDVLFQTDINHYKLFQPAYLNGMIPEETIDEALRRVLRAKFELGLFERPYVDLEKVEELNGSDESWNLAKEAAKEGMVLLKNDRGVLPLENKKISIAIVGAEADECRLGGYSGPGNRKVNLLEAFKAHGDFEFSYSPGSFRTDEDFQVIGPEYLSFQEKKGLKARYYDNPNEEGDPLEKIDEKIDFRWTITPPAPGIPFDAFSVSWEGEVKTPKTGKIRVAVQGDDGYRIYWEGKEVLDRWEKRTSGIYSFTANVEKGKTYPIEIHYHENKGNCSFKLLWDCFAPNKEEITREALKSIEGKDMVIAAVGLEEGEFRDRSKLSLPGHQEELLRRIAETGKPLIVLITGGGPVTMENWLENADAVLMGWYAGEAAGEAFYEVLTGKGEAGGRLPVTFPKSVAQVPLYYNHKSTGRGDHYWDMSGDPEFPFGYGLSYSQYEYENIQVLKRNKYEYEVSCQVKNVGSRPGREVCQLYIKDMFSSVARPLLELKGFEKISLDTGETKTVKFKLNKKDFEMLDKDLKPVVEPGDFRIMIGRSSRDIRLSEIITIK